MSKHVVLSNPLEGVEIIGPDQAQCAHRLLDGLDIPRVDNGEKLDLCQQFAKLIDAHYTLRHRLNQRSRP